MAACGACRHPASYRVSESFGGEATAFAPWTAAFVARLRELGWIEGRTIAIEYRWSGGRPQLAADFAAEFVRLNVDVIVTVGTYVAAVKQATSVIPIVFAIAIDPRGLKRSALAAVGNGAPLPSFDRWRGRSTGRSHSPLPDSELQPLSPDRRYDVLHSLYHGGAL